VITELAEMGVADHVLGSISGHLSRRMLEHYSHIQIDAKRQALDALNAARRSGEQQQRSSCRKQKGNPSDCRGRRRPYVTGTSQFGFARIAACR